MIKGVGFGGGAVKSSTIFYIGKLLSHLRFLAKTFLLFVPGSYISRDKEMWNKGGGGSVISIGKLQVIRA